MRKNHEPTDADQTDGEVLGRRALLRRAGTIAAIAGGAAVVQATGTGTAEAAAGDNVIMGVNDAGTAVTSVTSAATTGPTVSLTNSSSGASARGPLQLAKSDDSIIFSSAPTAGELFVADANSDLWYVNAVTAPNPGLVFTEVTANQVIGIIPQRVLDTRTVGGQANIISGASHVGASGLAGHQWIQVDLSGLAFAIESVFANLTAVTPTTNGYLTAANQSTAAGVAPTTSSLNFVRAVTLANGVVVPTDPTDFSSIWIYARATTHILLDVTAVNVPSSDFVNPGVLPSFAKPHAVAARRAAFAKAARSRRFS